MAKKVVIFGAGLVTKPMVDYLANHKYDITVTDIVLEKAQALAKLHQNVKAVQVDIQNEIQVEKLIERCDLTVSLLPPEMHPEIARKCIKYGKHMVTTSYISPAMKELDDAAKDAGIIILNEIGVDPGIDHMSAMKIFHHVENEGGKIVSFMSYCGGLPAPEVNTNPFGYKFSWSPKGVLKAAGNDARFMKDGKICEVEGKDLFKNYWFVNVEGAGTFEAYPNRDSMGYVELYGLKHLKTMYRGTFRNISHCDTWYIMSQMGFYKENEIFENLEGTVKEFILEKMLKTDKDNCLKMLLMEKYDLPEESVILKKFEWLGFFDDTPVPIKKGGAVDVLTAIMLDKMSYEEGERDLLVLHHQFIAEYPNKTQKITSTMIDYGIPNGDSSMARTVSLPAAIGVHMILEGKIKLTGVYMPILPDIYNLVLQELENLDIKVVERFY
ncbi:MAG: saccharopine dehydrogenase NADP-binding domain-containing protein [Armatimonadetes bacterium]|nr:saccharopine dehydrogenase NADP-binding domain-containing protein [Armatimonadota bacterium]